MPGTRGPVPVPLRDGGRDVTQEVLDKLADREILHTSEDFRDISQAEIKAALDRLGSRQMVEYQTIDTEYPVLTKEGETLCDEGTPEFKIWSAVREKGKLPLKEAASASGLSADAAKFGQGNAFRNKWIKKEGDSLVLVAQEVEDTSQKQLQEIRDTKALSDAQAFKQLKGRKLITTIKVIDYKVSKGLKYAKEIPVEVTDLTADMLASGEWETANFKPYNFNALGSAQDAGALHPLMKVRQEFRNIFFNQGFVEMPTNRYVDTGFWNFDALFVPQQHPARDMQDTFFISDPPAGERPRNNAVFEDAMSQMMDSSRKLYAARDPRPTKPRDYEKYFADVKTVHQDGAFGSIGYRYPYSEDECLRLCLRTHTTAVSTWSLHRLSEDPRPARFFSIDRVFRNETLDATHLAEFHQIEGVIADFDLTLGGLMKFMEDFFGRLGITNLRFKPAYNPYTEPSLEIYGYHPALARWVEIGNSGMFRPEMLEPMGLPKELRAYGFGLSLERPTMIKYGVNNIRELLGHKVDLAFIENNAAVRFDKN